MSQITDVLKYAKKAAILNQILLNYRQERQSVLRKDPELFRKILQKREQLILQLGQLHTAHPRSGIPLLQQQHIDQLVAQIQIERDNVNRY